MTSNDVAKVTYSLPSNLIEQVRSVVREGAAPSYSAFVESALEEALRKAKERLLAAEFDEAADDPMFLADIETVERDFETIDSENARRLP